MHWGRSCFEWSRNSLTTAWGHCDFQAAPERRSELDGTIISSLNESGIVLGVLRTQSRQQQHQQQQGSCKAIATPALSLPGADCRLWFIKTWSFVRTMASSLGAASMSSMSRGALQTSPGRLQRPTAMLQQPTRCSISRLNSNRLQSSARHIYICSNSSSSVRRCSTQVQAAADVDVAAAADQQPEAKQDKQQKQQKQKGQKQQQQQKQGGGECKTTGCSHISSYVCMFSSTVSACALTAVNTQAHMHFNTRR